MKRVPDRRFPGITGFAAVLWLIAAFAALPVRAAPDVPEGAFGSGAVQSGNARVEARLLVDQAAIAPGQSVRVGVLFELDRDWHIYWRNPGQSGLPTRLDWKTPGTRVGAIRWPAPHVFREADGFITTYGYSDSVLLSSEAHFEARAGETLDLAVDVDFLVCKVQCIPGSIALRRALPVAEQAQAADPATLKAFSEWDARVPVPVEKHGLTADALYSQSAIRPDDRFRAAISLVCEDDSATCSGLRPAMRDSSEAFVPDRVESIELEVTGTRRHPFADGLILTLAGTASSDEHPGEQRLAGVAVLENSNGAPVLIEIDLALPRAAAGTEVVAIDNPWLEPETAPYHAAAVPLWQAFLLALLGGLILNLMPCVLPVLAIKVFGIAERAHEDRREVLSHGAAYTIGILVAMAVLAGVVVGLRAAGTAVGWGFQFQEPIFIAAICGVLLVFALNLFGVFEISAGTGLTSRNAASGLRRSFFEGLLAVVVATPCSAPFLGTAVGFAFASSPPVIFSVFLAIGLGLAAPFVAITLVPGWARLIPKSGAWMLHLRAGLGFALLATVVWLLWVAGRSLGSDGVILLLGFLMLLGVATWIFGAVQETREDGRAPGTALLLSSFALAALAWLPLQPIAAPDANAPASADADGARPFAPAAIAAELALGRPVFVYFTADWCLTCKVNEHVVLTDPRIADELQLHDIATFKADWTLRDEEIRRELARFGRAGVPMYLVYDPRNPSQPKLLPELLTVDLLIDAFRSAGTRAANRS